MENHYCRICGLYNEDAPWGDDGQTPTYEYCTCCGVEFGYQDYTYESAIAFRSKWINDGAKWFLPKWKPDDWDLNEQLKDIPTEFI